MENNKEISIKDILAISRCNLTEFSIKYDVPYRTLVSWTSGYRNPPKYVVTALLRCVLCDIGYCYNSKNDNTKSL